MIARAGSDQAGALASEPPLAALRDGPMPARVGNVRVGTASWTDKTLIDSGTFYPPGVSTAADRLRYYARHFPVVEVDATFYALPAARNARAWVERTPEDFSFGVKAFAAMTGHPFVPARLPPEIRAAVPSQAAARGSLYARDLPAEVIEEIWRQFRAGVEPLRAAGILGYVLLQFPKWFARSRQSIAYIEICAERLRGYPVAVEFRQPDWLCEAHAPSTLDFLRSNGLIYVSVDEPQGTRASVPPVAAATSAELAVVRFHGRNSQSWDKPGVGVQERFRYLYSRDELAVWRPRIGALARKTREVHVLMNNCHRHYGVQNAKDLAAILAGERTAAGTQAGG